MVHAHQATIIAAVAHNNVIGDAGIMPWHVRSELQHFKETTMGGVLIMGRTTVEGIGKLLPGRRTIVLSRDPDYAFEGAQTANSLEQAYELAGSDQAFVAGGASLYRQALENAGTMVLSRMPFEKDGDTCFPSIPARWTLTDTTDKGEFVVETYTAN